jgi:hypothetical protein
MCACAFIQNQISKKKKNPKIEETIQKLNLTASQIHNNIN